MNLGKINLITPPDRLFNINLSYLLVYPSKTTKTQFQQIIERLDEDVNVFMLEEETDIEWLLSVGQTVDLVVIDIDRCDPVTKNFVSFLLANPNVYYLTEDTTVPWGLISRNRITDLNWILEHLDAQSDDNDDDDE
jgi:hypothetical protein